MPAGFQQPCRPLPSTVAEVLRAPPCYVSATSSLKQLFHLISHQPLQRTCQSCRCTARSPTDLVLRRLASGYSTATKQLGNITLVTVIHRSVCSNPMSGHPVSPTQNLMPTCTFYQPAMHIHQVACIRWMGHLPNRSSPPVHVLLHVVPWLLFLAGCLAGIPDQCTNQCTHQIISTGPGYTHSALSGAACWSCALVPRCCLPRRLDPCNTPTGHKPMSDAAMISQTVPSADSSYHCNPPHTPSVSRGPSQPLMHVQGTVAAAAASMGAPRAACLLVAAWVAARATVAAAEQLEPRDPWGTFSPTVPPRGQGAALPRMRGPGPEHTIEVADVLVELQAAEDLGDYGALEDGEQRRSLLHGCHGRRLNRCAPQALATACTAEIRVSDVYHRPG